MKIKQGIFSSEMEFTKEELNDKEFMEKVRKEVIGEKKSIVQIIKELYFTYTLTPPLEETKI